MMCARCDKEVKEISNNLCIHCWEELSYKTFDVAKMYMERNQKIRDLIIEMQEAQEKEKVIYTFNHFVKRFNENT